MDIVNLLREQAKEMANEKLPNDGWSVTMVMAAEEIERLRSAQHSVEPTCLNCGNPKSNHVGRGHDFVPKL